MSPKPYLAAVISLPALACAVDTSPDLELTVAALELPGVEDACYSIDVHNVAKDLVGDDALVWSKSGICASRYGNTTGSLTYIGTCDASPDGRINTVSLSLEGLCTTAGCDVADAGDPGRVAPDSYVNPCPDTRPCQLERPCRENADTLVEFNLTIMRDATQGFFDVVVNFEDIFCSAKLDCQPELLHRPDGERDLTAVLAFACTSGGDTCLYVDPPTLTCTTGTWTLDPSEGPGRISEDSPVLYGAAVYAGDEAYTAFEKQYWNVALGLDEAALATAGDCTLSWNATASEGYWDDLTTPAEATYPLLTWSRQIVRDGVLDCSAHPLDVVLPGEDVASVATTYTPIDAPHTFAYSNCESDEPEPSLCSCAEGYTPNANETVCVRELTASPNVEGTTYDVCAGFDVFDLGYSSYGARFTTSINPADFEFSQGNAGCTNPNLCHEVGAAPWTNRLRDVGVWICPAPVTLQEQPPYNEWIGFTRCVTVDTAGTYLVGIAGDNQVMLRVDGNLIYQSVSNENFAAWNVMRVALSAGTHVIELFGLNTNLVASFGAEIYGPFAASDVETPQEMAAAAAVISGDPSKIIFSTADLRTGGAEFQVSTGPNAASGLTCPDGFSLQLCGAQEAVCIDRDEASCNPR